MSNLVADVNELISRLEWGQPAFTIIDVRDRLTYNHGHITGAISIPLNDLADRAKTSLHKQRQIYVYGDHDTHANLAVSILGAAGFRDVCVIQGGLDAWKTVGGATEGV
ncbi:rhodanese-like domain-containing protein [Sphaerospermopsis kisseleviana CS-549]|jgi:rhodanese-related sulfurtransferase|uniref:Rhodanese domain-containing protein n=4 Tax=Sphaerospermopsis TaxID=752201 RepID=A0A480A4B5_9CYAN|nr:MULTISPECIES: rhodanese-like domain-containing protein [Sphaerospermopsis]BAZ81977.1 rhodanese domain-containing protein [Sphaerospermopsis kisseleviana NIES-73]MBC5794583.1 rhodanese-like domain-containing protein [Sphaerospermopsis sp. LEGE 00249]MBD2132153.1 rhodanese-like domain-containing protein [Sphaerospermopsis sp. FACHB-1094]MBD2144885.1 rhodanese-like domain-containing protein [Sphaerospermopsis sp. FACHB-1194]MBE9237299.1 rhodanese-like domain-containing protein [Sphaerospermops